MNIKSVERDPLVRVRNVMRQQFDLIDGMITVAEALKTMKYPDNKAFIVEKKHQDDEYGLMLVSDIGRMVLGRGRSPERVNIYEIMAKPFINVNPNMDIRYCARLFERFRLSRAPVVEHDGQVIGIVSFTDLVIKGMIKFL
jgi:predicted transcriptional regulator